MGDKQKQNRGISLRTRKRKWRVLEYALQGQVDPVRIGSAMGVPVPLIACDLRWVSKMLAQRDKQEIAELQALHGARLQELGYKALVAFERSRQDEETVTTSFHNVTCKRCKGKGSLNGDEGEWCPDCDGNGYKTVERVRRKVRGQAGDPQFLKTAIDAFDKWAKLYQLYPQSLKVVQKDQRQVHIHNELNLDGVPEDAIIEARRAVLRLKELTVSPKVIDVEPDNRTGGE